MNRYKSIPEVNAAEYECPNCGSKSVQTRIALDRFDYGAGSKAVQLQANIPFRKCGDCGFEYTDSEAEDIKHEVVCRHLGLLLPSEIIAIREKFRVSRAEFAEKTRIGEASLARWETAQLLQNPGNDNFIYLLSFEDNWLRLQDRKRGEILLRRENSKVLLMPSPRFRGLDDATIEAKRKETFQLRPAVR